MQLIHQYITLQLVQIIPFTNIIATLPNFPVYTIARVHNISIEGEHLTVYIATLYKRIVTSNTSKLSYTLKFNLRVIMDDMTVNR